MKEESEVDTSALASQTEQYADMAFQKWPSLMETFQSDSVLAKTRGVMPEDVAALGQMLHQWETYQRFCEQNGTLADLGTLPKHALEIITADFGTSILPHIASVQPIKERMGIVYYKTVKATKARGNVAVGDTLISPFAPPNKASDGTKNYPEGYAGEKVVETKSLSTYNTTAFKVPGTVGASTIRPRSLELYITVSNVLMKGIDDGAGNILGNGFFGSIEYVSADGGTTAPQMSLTFASTVTETLTVIYATDFEESGYVPEVNFQIDYTEISAEVFALTQATGMFKAFEFQNRFGQSAEEMIARDLTGALNLELGNVAISRLIASAVGSVDFYMGVPQYISYAEHMQQLKALITKASSTILNNAGRGYVNYLICGSTAAGVVATLPGWTQQIVDTPGSNIWGTLDGMTVIRAPHIDDYAIYPVYKGKGGFDTPLVWSPYMPLVVSKTLQDIENILKNRAVAAVWGGLKVVAPTFVTKIQLIDAAYTTPAWQP